MIYIDVPFEGCELRSKTVKNKIKNVLNIIVYIKYINLAKAYMPDHDIHLNWIKMSLATSDN